MLARIAELIRRFQENWRHELDDQAILAACRDAHYAWRERKLNPILTVRLFLLQILWGNTACNHLPHLAQLDLTGAAYCEARARLPLQVLQTLLARCTAQMAESVRETSRWLGHRLFILDGSSFSMPDNPELRDHFGQHGLQKSGCGFPIAHCLALVHYGSGLMQQVLTAPWRTHDLAQAAQLHPALESGDVLLGDRGFCSFAHLALLMNRQVHAIFRVHQRVLVDFTPSGPAVGASDGQKKASAKAPLSRRIRSLGRWDQLVQWHKPTTRPTWLSAEVYALLPPTLQLRELRYRVSPRGFRSQEITLVTTLCDAKTYSYEGLCDVYRWRWTIETCFGHLKTTMKLEILHCQTVEGVTKELTMFLLVYNLVRMTMRAAAKRQGVSPARISFIDALRWLATAIPSDEQRALVVLPNRTDRSEPRVRKRRPKTYPLMTKPRSELRQALPVKEVTA